MDQNNPSNVRKQDAINLSMDRTLGVFDLIGVQFLAFAGVELQCFQDKGTDANPDNAQGGKSDGRSHFANLSIFAFRQFDFEPSRRHGQSLANRRRPLRQFRFGHHPDASGFREDVFLPNTEPHRVPHGVNGRFRWVTLDLNPVRFAVAFRGVGQALFEHVIRR